MVAATAAVLAGCAGQMGQNLAPQQSADTVAITISSPSNSGSMSSPVTISASASGTSAIADMQALVDSAVVAESHGGSLQASIQPTAGSHQLTVTAKDSTGASGQKSLGFTVRSGSAAGLSITWPPEGATLPSPLHVAATSGDTNPGLNLSLSVDGQPVTSFGGQSLQADVPLEVGTHTITVSATDEDGGQAQQSVSVLVPAPTEVLALNDDATASSFLLEYATGRLWPDQFLSLPESALSMSGLNFQNEAFFRTASDKLFMTNADLSNPPQAVSEHSFVPALAASALSAPWALNGNRVLYESAAGSNLIRGFYMGAELPDSPFAAAGGSSVAVASPMAFNSTAQFGYLANPDSQSVERFAVSGYVPSPGQAGDLTSLGLTKAGFTCDFTLMDASGRFLFVTGQDSNQMTVLQANPNDDSLKMTPGSPFTISQNNDPRLASTGLYLFVSEHDGSGISTYKIDQNTGAPVLLSTGKDQFVLLGADPSGHFLLAGAQALENDGTQNTLNILQISQQTGALTLASSVRLRGSALPSSIQVFASQTPVQIAPGPYAFIGLAGQNGAAGELAWYMVDANRGVLNLQATSSVTNRGVAAQPIVVKPWGGAAMLETSPNVNGQGMISYSDVAQSSFLSFSVQDQGISAATYSNINRNFYARTCTACGNDEWNVLYRGLDGSAASGTDSLEGLRSLVSDPLGEFLFATRLINGRAYNSVFSLDPLSGAPALVPNGAISVDFSLAAATDAGGRFVYSVDPNGSDAEVTYLVLNNGVLHARSISSFMGTKIVIDPSDKYAIGVNAVGALDPEQGPSSVYVYSIDPEYGQLKPVAGPYVVPNTARDMAMDDAGKFLYVANGGAVSIFAFNANDGSLTEVPFSPEQVGTPQAPAVTAIAVASSHQ